jgi:hypothetical protein
VASEKARLQHGHRELGAGTKKCRGEAFGQIGLHAHEFLPRPWPLRGHNICQSGGGDLTVDSKKRKGGEGISRGRGRSSQCRAAQLRRRGPEAAASVGLGSGGVSLGQILLLLLSSSTSHPLLPSPFSTHASLPPRPSALGLWWRKGKRAMGVLGFCGSSLCNIIGHLRASSEAWLADSQPFSMS